MKNHDHFLKYVAPVAAGALLAAGPAVAQIDVTGAVAEIGNITTAVTTIGGAIIGVAAVAMAFRWVKAQFF